MGFPRLGDPGMLEQEEEEGVWVTTSRKYRRFDHLHDLEEYLLPDLDRNALHG